MYVDVICVKYIIDNGFMRSLRSKRRLHRPIQYGYCFPIAWISSLMDVWQILHKIEFLVNDWNIELWNVVCSIWIPY